MPRNVRSGSSRKPGQGKPGGSGTKAYQPGGSFWDFQAKPVAGANQFLTQAGSLAAGLGAAGQQNANRAVDLFGSAGAGNQFTTDATRRATALADNRSPEFTQGMDALNAMRGVAQRQVTGEGLENSASFKAARKAYSNSIAKRTNNAAALSGLGRSSTLHNAQAAGESQYLLPTIENAFAREERGIGRELGALGTQAQGYFGASGQRGADARTAISSLQSAGQQRGNEQMAAGGAFANLSAADRAAAVQNIGVNQGLGTQARGIEQEQLDAPYNEQMRLYSEALNSMYGPLGMVGGLIGGSSTSSKK